MNIGPAAESRERGAPSMRRKTITKGPLHRVGVRTQRSMIVTMAIRKESREMGMSGIPAHCGQAAGRIHWAATASSNLGRPRRTR